MIALNESENFRVIIAGGGVVGLTLANALQHAGIDYILLEGRPEFAPQLGASIAILPNGGRILDQLGCYTPLLSTTEPMRHTSFVKPDGTFLVSHNEDVKLFKSRFGYDLVFQDRQALLKVLYDAIIDKSKCRPNSKIARVDHNEQGIVVHCEDGSSFQGDLILGTDGVRSKVRKEMWRTANEAQPGLISEKEQKGIQKPLLDWSHADFEIAMMAEYKCLYGISSSIPGIDQSGDYHCSLDHDRSMMAIVGRTDRIYFFVFEKLDRVYQDTEIPRFSEEDKEAFVKRNSDLLFRKGLPFGEMYKHHIVSDLVCMEEAQYEHWTWGRFVMLGDSIHKTTANQGSGGNQGIESAAVVANLLKRLLDQHKSKPTFEQIQSAMAEYPKIHQERTNKIFDVAGKLTRIHALKGLLEKTVMYRVVPIAGDILLNQACETFVNAQYIEFLPVPERSLRNHMPYNPQVGAGKEESRLMRFFYALPLLGIAYMAAQSSGLIPSTVANTTQVDTNNLTTIFHHETIIQPATSPTNLFFTALAPIYSILLIEGSRRSNTVSFVGFPTLVAFLAQKFTFGVVLSMYFLFHYVFSAPIDKFSCLDLRMTDLRYTKTVLMAVGLFYLLPLLMISTDSDSIATQLLSSIPLLIGAFQYLTAKYMLKNTTEQDKIYAPLRDIPAIRTNMYLLSLVPTIVWLRSLASLGLTGTVSKFCADVTSISTFAAAFLWLVMIYGDLRHAGIIETTEELLKTFTVGVLLAMLGGPGAVVGMGWLWREELLATRKHWGALTPERVAKSGVGISKKRQ